MSGLGPDPTGELGAQDHVEESQPEGSPRGPASTQTQYPEACLSSAHQEVPSVLQTLPDPTPSRGGNCRFKALCRGRPAGAAAGMLEAPPGRSARQPVDRFLTHAVHRAPYSVETRDKKLQLAKCLCFS